MTSITPSMEEFLLSCIILYTDSTKSNYPSSGILSSQEFDIEVFYDVQEDPTTGIPSSSKTICNVDSNKVQRFA